LNEKVEQGERLGEVESVKAVSDINAPVSGEIIEVNSSILENLEIITNDCYNDGWLVKIQMEDPSEFESILSPEDYAAQLEMEEDDDDDDVIDLDDDDD
jgi:glycine cleavage system H protein